MRCHRSQERACRLGAAIEGAGCRVSWLNDIFPEEI